MNRVDYLQARLRQLRLGRLLPRAFSNWLARLELGEVLPLQPVFTHKRSAGSLLALLAREIHSRR